MLEIKEVDQVTLAFPANVIEAGILPAKETIPEPFWKGGEGDAEKWVRLAETMFYRGSEKGKDLVLVAKSGVLPDKAMRMVRASLGSYQPKHEHKMAGVAFMLSEFFEDYRWEPMQGETSLYRFEPCAGYKPPN